MRETLKSLQTISYSTRAHVRYCQRILLSLPMESRRRPNGFQAHCLDQCSPRIHSTRISVYRLRQLVAREHATELLACYGILFQGMGYLGSVHPE
jgi:hypothetical protein